MKHGLVTLGRIRNGLVLAWLLALAWGSYRDPEFWQSAEQRGNRLMEQEDFAAAAAAYTDPWRIGVAQYRAGNFKEAAQTFARVPGASGAFNRGNAALMQGDYAAAIEDYDRALGFRPGWPEALDNKALAQARQQRIDDSGANRAEESTEAYTPDDVVFDQKGDDESGNPPKTLNSDVMTDANLRAAWLRRVQTSPADFLQAKFAWQAAQLGEAETGAGSDDAAKMNGGGQ